MAHCSGTWDNALRLEALCSITAVGSDGQFFAPVGLSPVPEATEPRWSPVPELLVAVSLVAPQPVPVLGPLAGRRRLVERVERPRRAVRRGAARPPRAGTPAPRRQLVRTREDGTPVSGGVIRAAVVTLVPWAPRQPVVLPVRREVPERPLRLVPLAQAVESARPARPGHRRGWAATRVSAGASVWAERDPLPEVAV